MSKRAIVGRVFLFIAALFCLVLPVILVAHPISYVPLICTVLLVLVSWIYLQIIRRSISLDVSSMTNECVRGSQTALTVTLANRSFLPCARLQMDFYITDLFGDYDSVRTLSYSAKAHENLSVDFDVQFAHLGNYYAGISNVVVYDLLGLFSAKLSDGSRRQVTVRPRKMSLAEELDLTAVADESRRAIKPITADDLDYSSVREYRYGDPLKTVHWNLSAREGNRTMYTRLYETYVNPTLTIIIDPCASDNDPEELMCLMDGAVETAAELCVEARLNGVEAEICYLGRDGEPGISHLVSTNDACELVADMQRITPESEGEESLYFANRMLREAGLASRGSGNVALITARTDSEQLDTLSEIAMARRNAMAFLAVPRSLVGREREAYVAPMRQVSASGGAWWTIESNETMTEVVGL